MSEKGNKYIVYQDGTARDEFGNEYTFDKLNFIDAEGKKHTLNEQDVVGFYRSCKKIDDRISLQNFSFTFEVNVSANLIRGTPHDAHIVPIIHQNNVGKPLDIDFVNYVKSHFGKSAIITGGDEKCFAEDGYEITPSFEIKLISRELETEPIRENEKKLQLPPLENNQNLEELEELFSKLASHYEMNLQSELYKVIVHLYYEIFLVGKDNDLRNMFISNMLSAKEAGIRRRIPVQKGRTPVKQQNDFDKEKEKFISLCVQGIKELNKRKKNLNKTQLAEILFNDLNPLQSFRRKLKTFELSFDEILKHYSEQKPS